MKERIKEFGYWIEDKLKDLCGEITPDKRLAVIIIMLLLFTILNLYFTFTSIKTWGMEEERRNQLKIEHVKGLKLEKSKPNVLELDLDFLDSELDIEVPDSIYIEKIESYGG